MDANRKNSKETLEAVIDAVRRLEPDRADMENAAARVWARIGQEFQDGEKIGDRNFSSVLKLENCDDYRALISDYIAGRLSSARSLLFKDHTHECVACRNALNAARGATPVSRPAIRQMEWHFSRTVAILATVAVFLPSFFFVAVVYPLVPRLRASSFSVAAPCSPHAPRRALRQVSRRAPRPARRRLSARHRHRGM